MRHSRTPAGPPPEKRPLSRADASDLERDGPASRLLLSQYDRLVATVGEVKGWNEFVLSAFTSVAPNLLVALARKGRVPMTELEALRAVHAREGVLEKAVPPLANVRTFDPSGSVAGMRLLLQHEGEKRRATRPVVPAKTIPI